MELQTVQNSLETSVDVSALVGAFFMNKAQTTIEAYKADIQAFMEWVGVSTPEAAARELLAYGHGKANETALRYRGSMEAKRLSPATVNRRLASLRSLVALANTLGIVHWRLNVNAVKAQSYRDTRGCGKNGITLLFEATKGKTPKATRNRAILRMLYDLGLRRSEVCKLDLEDFTGDGLHILGKGRTQKERVTLPVQTTAALREWLQFRGNHSGALFTNFDHSHKGGGRLTGRSIARIVGGVGASVNVKTTPHGLRHSAITEALELTNGNVRAVARFSRHKDIRVLSIYDDNRTDIGGNVAAMVAALA
jgi:integrase/recombinase XerC